MRFVSTRGRAPAVPLRRALLDGLAPDGGLYMPEQIPAWSVDDRIGLAAMPLGELGARILAPYVGGEVATEKLLAIADDALDFPIPLVEVEPGIHALELFHGPTLAFKDVAARVMARLFAVLTAGEPLTVLVATSGDTGGAVAHAFAGVPGTRVLVLYPDGRVSPTQEAQLTMFNGDATNVAAFAVDGAFDDCQRLVKQALADAELRRDAGVTSANSINIGRLLPQMVYYVHAVGRLSRGRAGKAATEGHGNGDDADSVVIAVPSGNFGYLTAGVIAKRSGLGIARFVAATNVNDVVPAYLKTGRFQPRPSISTIANAMDVGNPSNFERLLWLYGNNVDAVRAHMAVSVHTEDEVCDAIKRVYERTGYLLDPHSAIGYLAACEVRLKPEARGNGPEAAGRGPAPAIFLATAHPAKFREVVEPIIGRAIDTPPALAAAIAKPRRIFRLEPTLRALRERILAG